MQAEDYSEWVPMSKLVKGLVVGFLCLEVVISFTIIYFEGLSAESFTGLSIAWGILALIGFLFWNYRGIYIQISNGTLTVTYGKFNKKTYALADLVSCKRTRTSFGRYFGIGIRYGIDGSVAYSTSFGDAVEVAPREGQVFVFSSKHPEKVCETINNLKVR